MGQHLPKVKQHSHMDFGVTRLERIGSADVRIDGEILGSIV